ncbi:MAG TPA: PDZ domain-containing protein [Gemmatimonadales bacterium]|nr:PDZ domain-containing protein [Gemmatimonadales bacterium]
MRHPAVHCLLALGLLVLPLSAQANQKISILSNDTSVTIERGERNSCRVEVNGRALAEREATPICENRQRSINWGTDRGWVFGQNLDSTARGLRFLMGDSVMALKGLARSQAAMARELASRAPTMALFGGFDSLMTARPIIGVTVDTRARDTDRYGAYIVAVTPSGPADKAGLRSGDILTRVAGRSLTSGATKRAVSSDESRPYVRLIEVMSTLDAGKEISVEYRRGDANLTTKVTPREDDQVFAVSTTRPPLALDDAMTYLRRSMGADSVPTSSFYFGDGPTRLATVPGRPGAFGFAFGGVLGSTEMAPMNEKLGRYFGAESGVLILDTDERNALGLQPGDVVQSIDGRSIENPNELGRVLRSYESGDRISIGLVREKKTQTVSARLP